jgi:hypothetical protein
MMYSYDAIHIIHPHQSAKVEPGCQIAFLLLQVKQMGILHPQRREAAAATESAASPIVT